MVDVSWIASTSNQDPSAMPAGFSGSELAAATTTLSGTIGTPPFTGRSKAIHTGWVPPKRWMSYDASRPLDQTPTTTIAESPGIREHRYQPSTASTAVVQGIPPV